MNSILKFIEQFKYLHKQEIENIFLNGNCYYFALILFERFKDTNSVKIKYLQVYNHFLTEIDGKLYDIRGDITDKYINSKYLVDWDDYEKIDSLEYTHIVRDCINF